MPSLVTMRLVTLFRSFTALGISRYTSKDVCRGSIFVFARNFKKPTAKLSTFERESGDVFDTIDKIHIVAHANVR